MSLSITIDGKASDGVRSKGRSFLTALTGSAPDEQAQHKTADHKDIGSVDVVNWVLAVPGTIAALIELKRQLGSLTGRKAVRKRIEPTFQSLKDEPSVTLNIGGRPIDLGDATLDDVLDALAEAELHEQGDT